MLHYIGFDIKKPFTASTI